MSNGVIEATDLGKHYGNAKAVSNVSFSVPPGEIFGLLGPNGAGKTTTILMLLGLTEISSGTARVFGHDPARAPLAVKRLVGYMPDSVGFYDYLTAADNLHYTAQLMGFSCSIARSASWRPLSGSASAKSPTGKSAPFHAACGSGLASPRS
jgi:ABC-2 type transport system ATP-binding protein